MALGRKTQGIKDVDNTELESSLDLVQGLEDFRATFIAASDSCSIAVNERGELRAWGSFSVCFSPFSFLLPNRVYSQTESSVSMAFVIMA